MMEQIFSKEKTSFTRNKTNNLILQSYTAVERFTFYPITSNFCRFWLNGNEQLSKLKKSWFSFPVTE